VSQPLKLTTFLPIFSVFCEGLTNLLHLHVQARELDGKRRANSLPLMKPVFAKIA
jgi:hypothetical protein